MCGCRKSRAGSPNPPGAVRGYYAVLSDGTEVPKVSQGEKPFLSSFEARVEASKAGGGTVYPLKQAAAR